VYINVASYRKLLTWRKQNRIKDLIDNFYQMCSLVHTFSEHDLLLRCELLYFEQVLQNFGWCAFRVDCGGGGGSWCDLTKWTKLIIYCWMLCNAIIKSYQYAMQMKKCVTNKDVFAAEYTNFGFWPEYTFISFFKIPNVIVVVLCESF